MTVQEALNIAGQYHHGGQLDAAAEIYQKILAVDAGNAGAVAGIGDVFFQQGKIVEAIASFRRFVELQPDSAAAHTILGIALLSSGELSEGWREFEWRWKTPPMQQRQASFGKPMWDGSPLAGRRILLHGERGNGDTIHFMRYVPLVAAAGGKVIFTCQPELHPVARRLDGVDRLLNPGEAFADFDLHCSLVSLPAVMQTSMQTIPANVPYLSADPAAAQQWRARMEADGKLKVGLVWAGQPNPPGRSITLAALAGLNDVPNVSFYSLQKGEPAQQARSSPLPLLDWTAELKDFGDTAALIENLDLVIGVDTSVVQLAGAMGKRTWILLKFVPDWRWMLQRPDSPWYPTTRLFRQARIGDWNNPIQEMIETLKQGAMSAQPL